MALRAYADGALFGEAIGDSPPTVLALHGWGRRGKDLAASLEGLNAIAPDLPGFGVSPAPLEVMGAEDYARFIEPLLDEFPDPPLVVGHSFGGRVAVCLAARNPDRVGSLILVGVPLLRVAPPPRPSLTYRFIKAAAGWGLISGDRLERERQRRGSADYRAATGVMRQILVKVIGEHYEKQLQALRSPVLLLWGANDEEVPKTVAELAADIIADAGGEVELRILPEIGHHLPMEDPSALRSVVDEVLAG